MFEDTGPTETNEEEAWFFWTLHDFEEQVERYGFGQIMHYLKPETIDKIKSVINKPAKPDCGKLLGC